jgi:hypothetical protein
LIIGILIGASYAVFIPSAEAGTGSAGPFTWVTTDSFMGMFGSFSVIPEGDWQVGDVIAAFVSDVVTGEPIGCIGGLSITQQHITNRMYGTLKAYGNDALTPDKDGANPNDTITFKYYSVKYDHIFDVVTTTKFLVTPATRVDLLDIPLPVELSAFNATFDSKTSQVTLKWRTESEINNLGFDVYRSEDPEGQFVKVNSAYIKGAGTDATPHDYQFVDESAVVGKTYYYYLETISFSGERERSHIIKVIIDVSGKVSVTGLMQPTAFALLQNFPNPFNPETWIPFRLAKDADVTIRIFNLRGQEVRTIHIGQMPAGWYDTRGKAVRWDGRDSYGQEVSSGIYFYSLTAGKFHATKKLTIIK